MKDLLLFPFGGNAREAVSVIDAINCERPTWNIIGFVDDDMSKQGITWHGYSVLGDRKIFNKYKKAKVLAVPGNPSNYLKREQLIDSMGISSERFVKLVHPTATIGPEVSIGFNTLIMGGVQTTVDISIGNHCVVRPNTVISHDVKIHDYCLIGANVSISGNVEISRLSYIGAGSNLIQGLFVDEGTLVGMGAVVLRSTTPCSVVVGNPARPLKRKR